MLHYELKFQLDTTCNDLGSNPSSSFKHLFEFFRDLNDDFLFKNSMNQISFIEVHTDDIHGFE